MARTQTLSAGFGCAPSLGPDLLHVGVIVRQALFTWRPDGPEQLQAVILRASSPDKKVSFLIISNWVSLVRPGTQASIRARNGVKLSVIQSGSQRTITVLPPGEEGMPGGLRCDGDFTRMSQASGHEKYGSTPNFFESSSCFTFKNSCEFYSIICIFMYKCF